MSKKLVPPDKLPEYGITIKDDARKNLEAVGRFPKRVKVTERTHAYVEDELFAFCAQRIAERDSVAA